MPIQGSNSANGKYVANQDIEMHGGGRIIKHTTFTVRTKYGHLYGIVYRGQPGWIWITSLSNATKQSSSNADGYSYDAGGSTTNLIYPIITLAIGLGLGFVAGRYFFKK